MHLTEYQISYIDFILSLTPTQVEIQIKVKRLFRSRGGYTSDKMRRINLIEDFFENNS